ncbi:hypothetical protein [Brevundimonas sp. DC300-4]|uniref:hypothetical protein n=1 Tax=Brevundimonas sp. DC300-4 TaxID=2804594 RepID=UPI003CE9FC8F
MRLKADASNVGKGWGACIGNPDPEGMRSRVSQQIVKGFPESLADSVGQIFRRNHAGRSGDLRHPSLKELSAVLLGSFRFLADRRHNTGRRIVI